MSQGQPQRPRADQFPEQEPIKYGDVLDVSGELASKPVAPRDAAAMQTAENVVFGRSQRGGPAAVMESAAAVNERIGKVRHFDSTDVAREQEVTISERIVKGDLIVTESVGGQVVGQYIEPQATTGTPGGITNRDAITIGEALEATALSIPDKPVDRGDAAAIQAAEIRATGINVTPPGGIGAESLTPANLNTHTMRHEDKTTVFDVLQDATEKLAADKAVTREDAQGVMGAELRNKPDMSTTPGGVGASMGAAARLNLNR